MSLAVLFHFLCTQHVSDINISIIRSLRLCCWITTSVVLFSVRCMLEIWCDWVWVVSVLQAEASLHYGHYSRRHMQTRKSSVYQVRPLGGRCSWGAPEAQDKKYPRRLVHICHKCWQTLVVTWVITVWAFVVYFPCHWYVSLCIDAVLPRHSRKP